MKILLLSTPRSGSTYITSLFAKAYPHYSVELEPWFKPRIKPGFNHMDYDNIIVNSHIKDIKLAFKEDYWELVNSFDRIYKIVRNDITEQILSLALAKTTNVYHTTETKFIKTKLTKSMIKNCYQSVLESLDELDKIPADCIFTYEDLTLVPILDAEIVLLPKNSISDNDVPYTKFPDKKEQIINYEECLNWIKELE